MLAVRAQLAPPTASVTLASPSPEVTGYRIYYGVASRSYTNTVTVGNQFTCTVSNLLPGVTYYFAATAYDGSGLESDFSNEVSYLVPSTLIKGPPTLLLFQTSTNDGAVLLLEDPGP